MPQFQILRMDIAGTPPLIANGRPLVWNDPAAAAADAKVYSRHIGEKLCVKPIVDEEWRAREVQRMHRKDYRMLPWAGSNWWIDAYPIWKDHYPHASLERPGYIAYTKNEEDGAKDKQSMLRPGAYLNKYFTRHMEIYGLNQKQIVDQFMTMYGPIDVKFATTEVDIVKTFDRGPQTCIAYGKRWPKDIHPATIYAAGDLAIAYIGDLDGKVSARAVVWPERKIHSRIYGDVARLTQGLTRLGYQWSPPIGARLKRVQLEATEYKNGRIPEGCFVAPYIDKKNQQGGGHLSVMDKDDHLVICVDNEPGSHHCGLAEGATGLYVPRLDEHPRFVCDNCEKEVLEVYPVFTEGHDDDGDEPESLQWCHNCRRSTWRCHYSGNQYIADVDRVVVNEAYWLPYYADMYAVKCEGTNKLFPQDYIWHIHLPDGTHKNYSKDYAKRFLGGVFASQLTGRLHLTSEKDTIFMEPGNAVFCAKQELKHRAFQCDGCDFNWPIQQRYLPPNEPDVLLCPSCADKFKKTKKLKLSQRVQNERNQIAPPLPTALP